MVTAIAVRKFVTRTTDNPDATAQSRHQGIAAGLGQQQVRGQPKIHQRQPFGLSASAAEPFDDLRQPMLVGLADRLGGGVHQ